MLTDLVLSRCHWLMTARTPAPPRKDLHEQTTWRSVAYMAALNGVAPDPIKLKIRKLGLLLEWITLSER